MVPAQLVARAVAMLANPLAQLFDLGYKLLTRHLLEIVIHLIFFTSYLAKAHLELPWPGVLRARILVQCFLTSSGKRSRTRFKMMPCSRNAFSPASTSAKPSVESSACFTISSPSPLKPVLVMLTKVALSDRPVKVHSTVVGAP